MADRIRVGIISADDMERGELAEELAAAQDLLVAADPGLSGALAPTLDVAVIGCGGDQDWAWQTAEDLARQAPTVAVVKIVDRLDEEAYRQALRLGIRELLPCSLASGELLSAVYQAYDSLAPRSAPSLAKDSGEGRLISIFSTKGGVGKTTIASNLAVLLAQAGHQTVLVDLDLESGDAALALDVVPRRSIVELADEINRLDIDLLESYLIRHKSGAMVLCAPGNPAYGKLMSAQHVEKMLRLLRDNFQYVVVDAPNYFQETMLPALQLSTRIILVGNMEIFSVKNMRSSLDTLDTMGMKEKVRVVLNKTGREGGIKVTDIAQTLDMPIWATLPGDEAVVIPSINQGVPLVLTHGKSRIGQALHSLRDKIVADEHPVLETGRKVGRKAKPALEVIR